MQYDFNWPLVLTGEYGQWIKTGFYWTLKISGLSIVISMILGTLVAVMRMTGLKLLEWISLAYTEFFRNTPLLVQIFFWYFGSDPLLRGMDYLLAKGTVFFGYFTSATLHAPVLSKWLYSMDFEFVAGVIALSVYTSAFIAEEIRSGIFSIPKNQLEASRACGLSFLQAMRYVILPQAFRIIIPPLISQCLNLIKNSSLCMTIGVAELTYQARQIESYSGHAFEAFTACTLIYLVISLVVSFSITMYNNHFLRVIKY